MYSNTLFYRYSKILAFISVMGSAVVIPAVKGIKSNPQLYMLSDLPARHIIREFLNYSTKASNIYHDQTLFDFTTMESVSSWTEQSDTVRTVGKSKAVITLQKTQEFQRAVYFTLLNPQANGAAFAGVRTETNFNLEGIDNININCRGQGKNDGYKIVLRHRGEMDESYPTYEQFFTAPMSSEEFSTVSLPLANFKAYRRGMEVKNADPLDVTSITSFGLQVYGGVYETNKQSGVSSLEINTINATA